MPDVRSGKEGKGETMRIVRLAAAGVALFALGLAAGCAFDRLPTNRPGGKPTPAPDGPGWTDLLDAEHAPGWKAVKGHPSFAIKDGVLHISNPADGGYVGYMPERYGDFELHLEFKVNWMGNSGVFFRSPAEDPVFRGIEVQVLGDHGRAPTTHSCGALYDVATPMYNVSRPAGQWNSYDITCRGSRLVVVCNGWKVLDVDLDQLTMPVGKFDQPLAERAQEGHFLLQDHHCAAWYRNIRVKRLDP